MHNIPVHVAIIMDGNGRWAKKQGLPRIVGHKRGVRIVKEIVETANDIGLRVLTLYAFSTENWKRPAIEVKVLMVLLRNFLKDELANLVKNNVRFSAIGQIERLPREVQEIVMLATKATSANAGLRLNVALSYGGRSEIVRAAQLLAKKCLSRELRIDDITEESFGAHLYTAGLPDPDLLIRTGGEHRLSNFLLWQLSYAELYVTEIQWPDFHRENFLGVLLEFQRRERRFGRISEQLK